MSTKNIIILAAAGLVLAACHSKRPQQNIVSTQKSVTTEHVENFFANYDIADLDRNKVSTSEEIAKHEITVIDFWASWCGPCRGEMPVMVDMYNNYKDKGLGIIGISLDEDYDAWKKAVDEDQMLWMQLSELRGWDCTAAQDNSVQAIPHTIVVDKRGKILATGLRGHELVEFVDKQLSK